jgi:uncharacterized protein (TIGR02300 family)
MSKDLGTKHVCFKCATKFYDLKRPVPACPKCGADQRARPAAPVKAATRRPLPSPDARSDAEGVDSDAEVELEPDGPHEEDGE